MTLSFSRTRLAPSPTGSLHLGHARTFLITWWLARSTGAEIILRMEDLDARRALPDRVQQTYDDLRWLGIDWDAGPPEAAAGIAQSHPNERENHAVADGEIYVQSQRRAHYEAILDQLWLSRAIYPCICSRADIAQAVAESVGAPQEDDVQLCYPNSCRQRFETLIPFATSQSMTRSDMTRSDMAGEVHRQTGVVPCWRFRVPSEPVAFNDCVHGPQTWDIASDSGDFPVTRFDGTPAYQLAVVADDAAMGIDCVIRGDDLLSSTPRQIRIYEALGVRVPIFCHVPLVVGVDGKRLAKRHGESRIAQFREAGVTASRIVGWVAWRCGQISQPREMDARELVGRFDLAKLPRQAITLTADDLAWLK